MTRDAVVFRISGSHPAVVAEPIRAIGFILLIVSAALAGTGVAAADTTAEIDRLITESQVGPVAAVCSDEDFIRRVYLDLWGVIPSAEDATAFFGDPAPDKRARLVDRLIASPDFARQMAYVFDQWLLERRPDKGVSRPEWRQYLTESFLQRKPFDQLAREILVADGTGTETRVRAKFLLDHDCDPVSLVRDIGRAFLGCDLQCAQCHDHPTIDDYRQDDFYGMLALVERTHLYTDAQNNNTLLVGERAEGQPEFHSVFSPTDPNRLAIPHLPAGKAIAPPLMDPGSEYLVAPATNVRPIPRYSLRSELAKLVTIDNPSFDRAAVNRLWSLLFGRGIVEPVDLHHSDNPPIHPKLLDLLAVTFKEMNYDVAGLLAILAKTQAYQRSMDPPDDAQIAGCRAEAEHMAEEATAEAEQHTAALQEASAALKAAAEQRAPLDEQMEKSLRAYQDLRQQFGQKDSELHTVQGEVDQLQKQLADSRAKTQLVEDAAAKATAAAQALAADAPVQNAANGLVARAAELKQADAASEKKLAERQTVLQQLTTAHAELRTKLLAAREQVQQAYAAWQPAYDRWREDDRRRQQQKLLLAESRRRKELATALVASAESAASPESPAADEDTSPAAANPDDQTRRAALREKLLDAWCDRFVVARPRQLSPEQLAWSAAQATGQLAIVNQAAGQEWDANHPAPENLDPTSMSERNALRDRELRRTLIDRLEPTAAQFVHFFGAMAGQLQSDFHASADQALFLANSSTVYSALAPQGTNLAQRLVQQQDPQALSDELYLCVLSRHPTEDERALVQQYLPTDASQRTEAIRQLIWGLLTSVEFRFYR